ncbi:GNAT family N-acetyltransferase, partial [Enterococcus faecium]
KQGVGEALLTHAADFAREKQFATLTLNFWAKNQVADFYQRNGFQVERYRASKIL